MYNFKTMSEFEEILEDISKKDFDRRKYVELVLKDESMRDFVVNNMIMDLTRS